MNTHNVTLRLTRDEILLSLKGAPSLRETVFSRARNESVVDRGLSKLIPALYRIQDCYVRKFSLSGVEDAVGMQFNGAGTHIGSTTGYLPFIANNK